MGPGISFLQTAAPGAIAAGVTGERAHEQTPVKEHPWETLNSRSSFSKLHLSHGGELRGKRKHLKTNKRCDNYYELDEPWCYPPNGAPLIHVYVQRVKWAIKETNGLREVLGACLCAFPPARPQPSTSTASLMMRGCRQAEGRQGGGRRKHPAPKGCSISTACWKKTTCRTIPKSKAAFSFPARKLEISVLNSAFSRLCEDCRALLGLLQGVVLKLVLSLQRFPD